MNPILVQTAGYLVVIILGFSIVSMIQRGFFWKYLRVKMSFGKFVLVKIREINRDLYAVGDISESTLVYKRKKETKRITIKKDKPVFYKTIGITMVDVDGEKNAMCSINYEGVEGFDAVKTENLYVRALTKPQISNNREKLIMLLLVVAVIISAFAAVVVFRMSGEFTIMKGIIENLNTGLITATSPI